MKTQLISGLILIGFSTAALAGTAPLVNKELKALKKKVTNDLSTGALTKNDGDELNREISEVRGVEDREPTLTRATRRDLREKVSKIRKDLERKEKQAKAQPSASPTP